MTVISSRYGEVTERDTIAGTMRIDQRTWGEFGELGMVTPGEVGAGPATRPAE